MKNKDLEERISALESEVQKLKRRINILHIVIGGIIGALTGMLLSHHLFE